MNYAALIKAISTATVQLQGRAAATLNQALVIRNWMVGAWVIEFEQTGKDRAKYGARLLETLAHDLKERGLKGLDERSLLDCRSVYRLYPQIPGSLTPEFKMLDNGSAIPGSVTPELVKLLKSQRFPSNQSRPSRGIAIRGSLTPELPTALEPAQVLRLSWTHLQELIRIDDPWKRAFFENECLNVRWSVRQLQRQIGSLLYERTGLSANKKAVIERARKQAPRQTIADMLRDPYVLEFANLAELPAYTESQLELALLDHLQHFLLELGRGLCFEARQFRMTEGRKHHRVDLVFYHRLLRCHVLIDLKIRAFQPADAGQMNFYVNWFKANMLAEGDAAPVGIVLCSDKGGAEVEFATAGMDQKLFVSRYLTALPPVAKLRAFLEADRERIESLMPAARGNAKLVRRKPVSKSTRRKA